MKRFFLPAIRLLNNMKFSQKIFAAILFFFIPIIIFLIIYGNKAFNEIENNKRLNSALVYMNALKEFYVHIPVHRGMMNIWHHGDRSFDNEIEKLREEIKDDIKLIDSIVLTNDEFVYINEKWNTIKNTWQNGTASMYNRSPIDCFEFHTEIIEKTSTLMKSIGKQFNPAVSSNNFRDFYLMKILTEDITTLTEFEGKIRGVGSGIVIKKVISDFEKHEIISYHAMTKIWLNILKEDMEILLKGKDIHNERLGKVFKKTFDTSKNFLTIIDENIIDKERIDIDTPTFFKKASESIELIFSLYDDVSLELQEHIIKQNSDFRNKIFLILALVIALLFILFYFNIAFYISFMDTLKRIKEGAQGIGEGKYDTRINLETKDEMTIISETFNKMAKATQHYNAFLKSYKNAIDKSAIVSISVPDGRIIYANDKFYSRTGYSREEVIGNTHRIMTHPDSQKELFADMWKMIKLKNTWNGIIKNRTKNGGVFYADTTIVPIVDESNQITEYIAIRKDITDLINSKQELIDQLYADNLTGLPNRLKLIEDLKKDENRFLIQINVDRFKEINDYYGYDTGDRILIALKERLLQFSEKNGAVVYRVHADEFVILAKKSSFDKTLHEEMRELHTLLDDIPYKIEEDEFNLNITIGASAKSDDQEAGRNDLLVNADLALRSAKKEKKEFLIFDSTISLKEESENNLKWTQKLKEAIKEDRIISYFQPIVNNKTKKIEKYECLMRLVENDGSVVSPYYFIQTAKKAKIYTKLTRIMIEKAFNTFKQSDYRFSINISADDILDKDTAEFIKKSVKESPIAKNIVFEIVESEGIENFIEVSDFINYVKSLGCKIAIDDFGTGYSNFEYLMKLNIDIIKIDGSLIKNLTEDKDAQIIVETIIDFAKKLNIQIIAEYVHSKEIQEKIEDMKIEYSQGFYLSEPKNSIEQDLLF